MTRPSLLESMRRMNQRSLFGPGSRRIGLLSDRVEEAEDMSSAVEARAEAIQRLQVGLSGIAAMVLLVGLASIIGSQADQAENAAVPEAAPTTEPKPEPTQANPLADAGVVPDIVAEPSPAPAPSPLDLPSPLRSVPDNAAPPQ